MNIDGVDISLDNLGQDLLELLVGERWPNGDEGAMRSLAAAWGAAADQLEGIRQTASAAAGQVSEYCKGANGDAFASFWSAGFDDGASSWPSGTAPAALPFAVKFCQSMASALNAGATQIETTKDTIMGNIAILVATVAPQIAAGFFDFGATDATAIAEVEADRVVVQSILDMAKEMLTAAVEQAIEQGLMQAELNFVIQFKEVAEGHASGIDWGQVEGAGVSGAAGGALGAGFGYGLGKVGGRMLGKEVGTTVAERATIGVASGSLTNASLDLIENGKISASDFAKGSLSGVLGGMGGAEAAAAGERPDINTEDLTTGVASTRALDEVPTLSATDQTVLSGMGMPHTDSTAGLGTTVVDAGSSPGTTRVDTSGLTVDPSRAYAASSSIARILGGGETQDASLGALSGYDAPTASSGTLGSTVVSDTASGASLSGSGFRVDGGVGVAAEPRGYTDSAGFSDPNDVTVGARTIPTSARTDVGGTSSPEYAAPSEMVTQPNSGAGADSATGLSGVGDGTTTTSQYSNTDARPDTATGLSGVDDATTTSQYPNTGIGDVVGGVPVAGGDAGVGSPSGYAGDAGTALVGSGGVGHVGGDSGFADAAGQGARFDGPSSGLSSGRFYGGSRDAGLDSTSIADDRSAGVDGDPAAATVFGTDPVDPRDFASRAAEPNAVDPSSQDPSGRATSPGSTVDEAAGVARQDPIAPDSDSFDRVQNGPSDPSSQDPSGRATSPGSTVDEAAGVVRQDPVAADLDPFDRTQNGPSEPRSLDPSARVGRSDSTLDDTVGVGRQDPVSVSPDRPVNDDLVQPRSEAEPADPTAPAGETATDGPRTADPRQPENPTPDTSRPDNSTGTDGSRPDTDNADSSGARPDASRPDVADPDAVARPQDDPGRADSAATTTDPGSDARREPDAVVEQNTLVRNELGDRTHDLDFGDRTRDPASDRGSSWAPGPERAEELAEVSARAEPTERGVSSFGDPVMSDLARRVAADPDGAFTGDIHGDGRGVLSGLTRMSPEEYLGVLDANGHLPGQAIRLLSCEAGAADDGFAAELARVSGCTVIAADTEVWSDEVGHVFATRSHVDGFGDSSPDIPPNGTWHEFSPDGTKTRVGTDGFPPGHEEGFGGWGTYVGETRSRGTAGHDGDHTTDDASESEPERRGEADDAGAHETDDRGDPQGGAAQTRHPDPATGPEHGPGRGHDETGTHAVDGPAAAPREAPTEQVLTREPAPTREARAAQDDEQEADDAAKTFLLMCTEYSPEKGGVVVFNRSLAEGLADAGQNVVVRIGEDASPYADAQRPNLRIIGPKDLPTDLPEGKKPDPRLYLGSEHDPAGMPEHVDYVVGHTRFSGPDAKARTEPDADYPDAKVIHFVHMVPEALGRVKENGDPPEPGEAAKGIVNHAIERDLVAGSDLAVGVGPAITENVREMVAQAHERAAQTGQHVATQAVHELIPGMEFRDRAERSTEGRPLNVFIFGRADVGQKGARAAADVVGNLREAGLPVRLTVRGVPSHLVEEQSLQLGERVGSPNSVEVRPFTVQRSDLDSDLDDADVMVMTSRAEGFGLTAQEAAAAGVPVVVPSSSGFGRWLGESGQFSPELTGPSIVPQGFEDQVPVDTWFDALRSVVEDYPAAQQRALDLQQEFKDQGVSWAQAVGSLIEKAEGLQ